MTGALLFASSGDGSLGFAFGSGKRARRTAGCGYALGGGADGAISFDGSMKKIMLVSGSTVGANVRRTFTRTIKRAACAAATATNAPIRRRPLCIQTHVNREHAVCCLRAAAHPPCFLTCTAV